MPRCGSTYMCPVFRLTKSCCKVSFTSRFGDPTQTHGAWLILYGVIRSRDRLKIISRQAYSAGFICAVAPAAAVKPPFTWWRMCVHQAPVISVLQIRPCFQSLRVISLCVGVGGPLASRFRADDLASASVSSGMQWQVLEALSVGGHWCSAIWCRRRPRLSAHGG